MKTICITFNHLQASDGIAKSAIAIANYLVKQKKAHVVLRPVFIYDNKMKSFLSEEVEVKPVFGFYFRGFAKLLDLIPLKVLHKIFFGNKDYDVKVGFQHGITTKSVVAYDNDKAMRLVWVHGYDDRLSLKKYYLKADKVICVSKFNAEKLKRALNNNVEVDYSYNPIDETIVQKMGAEDIDISRNNSNLCFVTVGRHSDEKGYMRLMNIVGRLKKEGYNFTLWMIGNGPQHMNLQKQAKSLDIKDIVLFLGEQTNPHKYTSKADVYICSSYAEGYSTACVEACMLGIPVLSTDVSGSREIIADANAGKVVGISDEELFSGMKYVLDNFEIIDDWKKRLRTGKENFYGERRMNQLLSILEIVQ